MPAPRLTDDGQYVTLDLHGAVRHEAEPLITRVVAEAHRRGRSRVKIIHGTSTSALTHRNDTLKHRLYALLDHGTLAAYIANTLKAEGHTLLALRLTPNTDARRMSLSEFLY